MTTIIMKEEDIQDYFAKELQKLELQKASLNLASQQQMIPEPDPGIVKEQLYLGEELTRIDYLLRSWTIKFDSNTGQSDWGPPEDEDMIILTEYGVQTIRNLLSQYLNKNTLLSNYDEETIMNKMKDFATTLNDLIFQEYEKIFNFPSIERCKQELENRLDRKRDIKKYAYEILGLQPDEDRIKREVINQVEDQLEKELEKIRQKLMKDKYKRFSVLLRGIQDMVHSTYLRALNGMERRSMRPNISISENSGANPLLDLTKKKNSGGWFWKK